jgi:hypothetical protein
MKRRYNRSVMPLDVLGCTRNTVGAVDMYRWKSSRDWDHAL